MGLSYVLSSLILGAIGALALAGCGESSTNVAQDTETQGAALAAAEALGYIPSSKAGEHMGEEGTVRGSVKDYNYISGAKGRPYILIFDKPGIVKRRAAFGDLEVPESFKVVIWKDYHKNFPANFAGAYVGHTVCATGLIVDYNGDPAIEAHDPSQLKIDC